MIDTIFLHLFTWRENGGRGTEEKQRVVYLCLRRCHRVSARLSIPLTPAPIALAWALVVSRAFHVFTPDPAL